MQVDRVEPMISGAVTLLFCRQFRCRCSRAGRPFARHVGAQAGVGGRIEELLDGLPVHVRGEPLVRRQEL